MAKHMCVVWQFVLLVAVIVSSQPLVKCYYGLPGLRGEICIKGAQGLNMLARFFIHVAILRSPMYLYKSIDRLMLFKLRDLDM